MKVFLQFVYIVCFSFLVRTEQNIERLVDYFENWFERRTDEATVYEFPKDARMYEAKDKSPRGKYHYNFLTCILKSVMLNT